MHIMGQDGFDKFDMTDDDPFALATRMIIHFRGFLTTISLNSITRSTGQKIMVDNYWSRMPCIASITHFKFRLSVSQSEVVNSFTITERH